MEKSEIFSVEEVEKIVSESKLYPRVQLMVEVSH